MRLDRSRPFGTIHPIHQGARYEQDGLYFNSSGDAIGKVEPKVVKPKPNQSEPTTDELYDGYDDEDLVEAPTVDHKPVEYVTVVRAEAEPVKRRPGRPRKVESSQVAAQMAAD